MTTTTVKPIEWLISLGSFLNDFFEAQCKAVEAEVAIKKSSKANKLQSSVRKVAAQKQPQLQVQLSTDLHRILIILLFI